MSTNFTEQVVAAVTVAKMVLTDYDKHNTGVIPNQSGTKKRKAMEVESEDESSEEEVTYPEVTTFFGALATKYPMRNLYTFGDDLTRENFYHINELRKKDEAYFMGSPFFLSSGNASFVVESLEKGVRKAKKSARRN